MANLPEKNIVTVSKVTSIPSNTNVFINANGEFVQANIDDVVSAGNQFKVFNGNLILAKGTSEGYATDFEGYGNSTQDGEPTPDNPIEINSVGDKGYFDGELLQGVYAASDGVFASNTAYVCNKNIIPCNGQDKITLQYEINAYMVMLFYDENKNYLSYTTNNANALTKTLTVNAPANAKYFNFNINGAGITPTTAKHICVTINGMYALVVKNGNKNLWEFGNRSFTLREVSYFAKPLQSGTYIFSATVTSNDTSASRSIVTVYDKDLNNLGDYPLDRNARKYVSFSSNNGIGAISLYASNNYANSVDKTATYADIQLELGDTMTDYVPHESKTTYIPIAQPLRGIGEVKDEIACVDGVYGVVRGSGYGRITSVTKNSSDTNDYLYYRLFNDKKHITTVKCNTLIDKHLNTLIGGNSIDKVGITGGGYNNVIYINVGYYLSRDGYENNVEAMNTWLAENPTYVEYELAEPTFEPFTDQTPFYSMKTFDGVTHISSEAEMDVEVPTSKAGGYASLGWAKSNLLEIELNNLIAKVNNVEVAVVNS